MRFLSYEHSDFDKLLISSYMVELKNNNRSKRNTL